MGKRRQRRALHNELKRTKQALQKAESATKKAQKVAAAKEEEAKNAIREKKEAELATNKFRELSTVKEVEAMRAKELAADKEEEAKKAIQEMNEMSSRMEKSRKKISWECDVDGGWIPYQPDISTLIEKAYTDEDKDKAHFSMSGWAYEIDFTRNQQQQQHNLRTGVKRNVRRQEKLLPALAVTQPTQIVWECEVKKVWIQYSPEISQILELAWNAKATAHAKTTTRFKNLDSWYEIDMKGNDLEQVNTVSKYRRSVRRREIAHGFPDTWSRKLDERSCHFVPVEKNTTEWKTIDQELKRTIPTASLHKVERVQNLVLWDYYSYQQKRISRLSRDGDPNVKNVWHGTRANDPRKICADQADGFMTQCSKTGMWGQGLYFAEKASYSHNYAYSATQRSGFFRSGTTTKTLLFVNLVVGEEKYLKPDYTLRRCPDKEDGTRRYDTVTGTTNGSKVYVVYENGRAYPAYLVSYV